jgi:cytochrome c551/c552
MGEFIDWDMEDKKLKEKELIGEKQMKLGASLIEKYGCFGCHDIKGMEKAVKIGPYLKKQDVVNKIGAEISSIGSKPFERFDLGKVADKVNDRESYLRTKLKSPRVFRDGLLMPNFGLTEKEIDGLIPMLLGFTAEEVPLWYKVFDLQSGYEPTGDFAKIENEVKCLTCHAIRGGIIRGSLSEDDVTGLVNYITTVLVSGDIPDDFEMKERLVNVNDADGRGLYGKKGCHACHQIGNDGGAVGPNLSNVGSRLRPGYIFIHIKNPQKVIGSAMEPNYNMSDEEALKITKFLISLKKKEL